MIFRYPGGKSKVAKILSKYIPDGIDEYREVFVGGGGLYFSLAPNRFKSRWINDKHNGLIEVYKALRDRSEEFLKLCRSIPPAEVSEELIATKGTGKGYNKRLGEIFESFKYNEEMDQALRYFFINRTVWGGRVNYDPEYSSRLYYSNPNGWNIVTGKKLALAARHVKGTKITSEDFEVVLDTPGENVFAYLDPPYIVDTGFDKGSKLYQHGFSVEDHERFVECCKRCKHRIMISYDDKSEVRSWFKDFNIYEESWKYCGTGEEKKLDGKELIITNYEVKDENMINWDD